MKKLFILFFALSCIHAADEKKDPDKEVKESKIPTQKQLLVYELIKKDNPEHAARFLKNCIDASITETPNFK